MCLAGRLYAAVILALPVGHGANLEQSAGRLPPAALNMAPETPELQFNSELVALTIASASESVMSPIATDNVLPSASFLVKGTQFGKCNSCFVLDTGVEDLT